MIFKNGNLYLDNKDFEIFKELLDKLTPITENTDYMDLNVPLLIPFIKMVENENINIKEINSISYDIDNTIMGTAILYHFKEYQKYIES